ncbi:rhodanese-like domain-containing protein [Mariniflexile sp.]|uniref:rhodanese-like domain-containing protein n=1 Tax=Mariniflexile sp. TaxID=1979402 RepID=UPI0040478932
MKKIISIVIVFMGSFILLYAGNTVSGKLQEKDVNEISVSQLHKMMKKKDFTLVNVHIPYAGEIPQTDLFIPYNEISGHLNELPAKDKKIVLYCRSDRMSGIATEVLVDAGYSNLYNLKGGMKAWEAAGYKLIDKQ